MMSGTLIDVSAWFATEGLWQTGSSWNRFLHQESRTSATGSSLFTVERAGFHKHFRPGCLSIAEADQVLDPAFQKMKRADHASDPLFGCFLKLLLRQTTHGIIRCDHREGAH